MGHLAQMNNSQASATVLRYDKVVGGQPAFRLDQISCSAEAKFGNIQRQREVKLNFEVILKI